jgi:choline dehydrogenase
MTNNPQTKYDYIIVGAGSAGCVLANRLSANHSVLLIEAGPKDHAWDFRLHMPAALSEVLANDTYNWFYSTEPEEALNNRELYCPRGRVLGGSSSINGMIYVRGNSGDFNQWARLLNDSNWDYEHCLPFFKRSESADAGDDEFRGRDGLLIVHQGKGQSPLFDAWLKAGDQAGFPIREDLNGAEQEGVGLFDCTIHKGKRGSVARRYLHPVMRRSNLRVLTNQLVSKIEFDGTKAIGVSSQTRNQGGSDSRLYWAGKEVIVSAGAINSPQLLMLSGIGDSTHLSDHGIQTLIHSPGVGQNLQDHLEIYVQYACKQPVSLYPTLKWYRKPFIGMQWYLNQTGAGATNHFEAGGFLKSDASKPYPDLQCHFLPIAMDYDGKNKHRGHGFQVHIGPMKPTSRGAVTLKDANPTTAPRIQFNYHQTEEDQAVMKRGIEIVRDIVRQPGFSHLAGEELRPGKLSLDDFIRQHAESAYHPSCTCAMGSVVDTEGKVIGAESLRVIDASIMPEITNGNLNAPVVMMAEKLSAAILSGKLT